ncbi:nuclear transport factor 2 family protein [Citricoccus sp. GCM10030269]|uniref:nuclear transport factor 2 family protein n=1 Tax=Citricoccus sp. GCM10030269 TaxID=3273388 RepID=UPI00361C517E
MTAEDLPVPPPAPVSAETRAAIADLDSRWAWAVDRHQYEALREILAPDVTYSGHHGELRGAETVIASYRARTGTRTTRHGLGNQVLGQVDETTVRGISTWHNFASNDPSPGVPQVYLIADFADTYVRLESGWRLGERVIRGVFRDPRLAPDAVPGPMMNGGDLRG